MGEIFEGRKKHGLCYLFCFFFLPSKIRSPFGNLISTPHSPFFAHDARRNSGDHFTTTCGNLFATSFSGTLCCTSPVTLNSLSNRGCMLKSCGGTSSLGEHPSHSPLRPPVAQLPCCPPAWFPSYPVAQLPGCVAAPLPGCPVEVCVARCPVFTNSSMRQCF